MKKMSDLWHRSPDLTTVNHYFLGFFCFHALSICADLMDWEFLFGVDHGLLFHFPPARLVQAVLPEVQSPGVVKVHPAVHSVCP